MARIKSKNSITSRAQAEVAMAQLNNIDQRLTAMELEEANAISDVREAHAKLQRKAGRPGMEAEKALLVKELESWADQDAATWPARSIETPFGRLGFRVGNPTVVLVKKIARNFDAALALLQRTLPDLVRTAPMIDKERILAEDRAETLDAVVLGECGLEVKQDDEFWIETAASKDLDDAAKKLRAA